MSLPELDWQIVYGRLAWAVVLVAMLASMLAAAWPRSKRMPNAAMAMLIACVAVLAMLPGEASPAYWLGLAFHWPSGLLVGLCLARLCLIRDGRREQAALPVALAIPVALAGAVLYLDAIGLLSLGIYYLGFEPVAAPLSALALAVAGSAAVMLGRLRPQALALLLATMIFMLLRLPTGNLLDALLDPLLWGWSLLSLGGMAWRRLQRAGMQAGGRAHISLVHAQSVEDAGKSA